MRKRCFPDLPATKCAVWEALLSRKGRPQSKGSYNKQPMEKAMRDFTAIPIYVRPQSKGSYNKQPMEKAMRDFTAIPIYGLVYQCYNINRLVISFIVLLCN